jgi:drug/metabolite transporter (DMT)-like permease
MKSKTLFLLIIAVIASSFAAIFVKWSDAPSTIISMYRMLLACVLLLPAVVKYRHEFTKISRKNWLFLLLAGILLALHFTLWFQSLKWTTVASSMIILALQPLLAVIANFIVYREKTRTRQVLAIFLSTIGIAIVGWGDFGTSSLTTLLGDLLSFLCIVALIIYFMLGHDVVNKISFWIYSFLVFLIAGVSLLLFNVVTAVPIGGYSAHNWHVFVLLAIFPTTAHIIYNYLVKNTSTTTISISMLGEPIGASLLAIPLLAESITTLQLLGGFFVLIGVIWYTIQKRSEELSV